MAGLVMLGGFGCGQAMVPLVTNGRANISGDGKTMNVKTEDGTAEWGANKLPDNWPTDAPVYPGATVQFSAAANPTDGKAGATVMLQTPDSGPTAYEYYKKELVSQGWKVEGNYQAGNTAMINATKEKKVIVVTVSTSGNDQPTAISVSVETKP